MWEPRQPVTSPMTTPTLQPPWTTGMQPPVKVGSRPVPHHICCTPAAQRNACSCRPCHALLKGCMHTTCMLYHHTMRFASAAKVQAKRMLNCCRILQCITLPGPALCLSSLAYLQSSDDFALGAVANACQQSTAPSCHVCIMLVFQLASRCYALFIRGGLVQMHHKEFHGPTASGACIGVFHPGMSIDDFPPVQKICASCNSPVQMKYTAELTR